MMVLNVGVLAKFAKKHRDAAGPLERCREAAQAADWANIIDIRKLFSATDGVPVRIKGRGVVIATVFNIKGNEYRLITVIDFDGGVIVIREVLTHAEYNESAWEGQIMKTATNNRAAVRDDYLDLVKLFPLRVIRSDKEQEQAVVVLSRLIGKQDKKLSHGQRQYADALSRFVQDYDQTAYPLLKTKQSPLQKLKYVMSESGMTPSQLAKVLDASQPLTSHLLTGKRNLTTDHMRKLGSHFKIDPGYFL